MISTLLDTAQCEGIAFTGNALAPLFLYSPANEELAPLIAALMNLDIRDAAAEWPFADDVQVESLIAQMQDSLADQSCNDELEQEYQRLFIGPYALPAPPWGSVYTDRECVIFGASTVALREWMRRKGIDCATEDGKPEDHIGTMLQMMAWIAQNKPQLLEEYLSQHLLTWASHYLIELEAAAETDFYRALALLTKECIEGIATAMDIRVDYPKYYR